MKKVLLFLLVPCFAYSQNTDQSRIDKLEKRIEAMEKASVKTDAFGYISIEALGCKPDADNTAILNNYLLKNKGRSVNLYIPPGVWKFKSQINIIDVEANITGAGSRQTILQFPAGVNGMQINRTKGGYWGAGIIEKLSLRATGKIPVVEGQSHIGAAWDNSGIQIFQRYTIRDVAISGFSHNGIQIWGDIRNGNDASWYALYNIEIGSCGGDGIWVVGPDANEGTAVHIDIRDCGGWGVKDQSFLGNQWFGVMMHANKKGPFTVVNPTERSTFVGCYSEAGQPPAVLQTKASYVIGGIHESGIKGGSQFYDGKTGQ